MNLRYYQKESISALYNYLRTSPHNPGIIIPTGGGKTPVIATICSDAVTKWNGRVLILSHVKELLEQAVDKIAAIDPTLKPGVYSAGLKSRQTDNHVIVAGIQSVHKKACELGKFDLILVDECHLLPPTGDGMYQSFLKDMRVINPHTRLIGLTATPYRLKSGLIFGSNCLLQESCYEVGVAELVAQGFLCDLISKRGASHADLSNVHTSAGEYIAKELEAAFDLDDLIKSSCEEIASYTVNRKSTLVFTSGVKHCEHVAEELSKYGTTEFITGKTPNRDSILERFKRGETKYLVNVNVLTTGFDAPNVDCVVLLRSTLSPGLYYQMVGRGFRLHPDKANCLVLDYGENITQHGPVDEIRAKPTSTPGTGNAPVKECPNCHSVIKAGYTFCPDCGFMFPEKEPTPNTTPNASDAAILSKDAESTTETLEVRDITYSVHTKRNAGPDAPKSMRVTYHINLNETYNDFVCVEHEGFARKKAHQWWSIRSPDPFPDSAQRAVDIAHGGGLRHTEEITLKDTGAQWPEIVDYTLGDMPEPLPEEDIEAIAGERMDLDELPF